MKFEAQVSRNLKVDTAVIGGGTAGVFAAICAAKCGANTLLIEKNSMLGDCTSPVKTDNRKKQPPMVE